MIVDAHIHLWNKLDGRFGQFRVKPLKDGLIAIGPKKYRGMPSWFTDCVNPAERAIAAFDDVGVNFAVVTQEYLDGNQNDYLVQVKKKFPERFFIHGLIDFTKPMSIKADFQKVVQMGFKGIKCPAMPLPYLNKPVALDCRELMCIWEQINDRKMILSIDFAAGNVQIKQFRNVLARFPKLKVAIGHFGMAGHPNWMEQIRLALFENVYIECGGIIWLFRHEYPPFKGAQEAICKAIKQIGTEKIMWGSDYPRTMVDFTYRQSMDFVLDGCKFLNSRQKAAFLGKNAARLYNITPTKTLKRHKLITEL